MTTVFIEQHDFLEKINIVYICCFVVLELQQNTDNMNAEYGHLISNMGSSFDQLGWLGSRPSGGVSGTMGFYGSRRQPQGGVGGNSRYCLLVTVFGY